jgi:high-affinity iron transporter
VGRLLLLAAIVAALLAPAAARADDGQFAAARAQVERARQLTQQAVDAAASGDRERGYQLARTAYLDHFEHAEVPLRLRDPNLVLDLEFAFAELRNGIRDGKPVGQLQDTKEEILLGLRDVDRTLAEKGFVAPLLAFLFSFGILFREGLESVLLIAILLGSLASGRATGYRRPLGLGVAAAIGATILTWLLATLVLDIAPVQRELLEGVTAVVAVVVLFLVSFWLVAQLEQRRRLEFTRARVASAIAAGSSLAFAGLGFTAVYREGFETVLFYQALAIFAKGLELWVVLGAATAAAALGAAAYAVIGLGRKLPFKQLLVAGASTLLLLSVAFAGNAVRSLQEATWIPVTPIDGEWARLPIFLAELTGIHPTREGILVQVVLLTVYVAGAAYVFGWKRLRRRELEAARA